MIISGKQKGKFFESKKKIMTNKEQDETFNLRKNLTVIVILEKIFHYTCF